MSIQVTCECGKQFQTGDEFAGRRARCPECGRELIIPTPGVTPYEAPKASPLEGDEFGGFPGEPEKTSGMAITSLVLGLSSLVCSITIILGLLTGIPAIIFGILGINDVRASKGRVQGRGLAITGIITGALSCTLVPVALMIALLLPAVQAAREAARRAQCTNNLKHMGLALVNFESATGHFPPPAITSADGKPLLSWRVAILPYLDQKPLYDRFKLDEPWDSPHNKALLAEMPEVYGCPSDPEAKGKTTTRYQVFAGPGSVFEGNEGMQLRSITDGTSNTLLVTEAAEAVPWTKPEDLPFDADAPLPELGSRHPGGVNALFADGSARFLKKTVPEQVIRALVTPHGDEPLPAGSF